MVTKMATPAIRTFRSADLAQVRELVASGLMEFAGGVEREVRSYVDHALKDDLADISSHYLSSPRGNFWVAESGGMVVGTVGVQPLEQHEEAELRRMSVSSSVRRQGLGQRLLETTEDFCRDMGYRRILLSTVDTLQPALAMYRKFGYQSMKEEPSEYTSQRPITVHHLIKDLYDAG